MGRGDKSRKGRRQGARGVYEDTKYLELWAARLAFNGEKKSQ